MIWLRQDHEARKTGSFQLCLTIQKLVSNSSLVLHAWTFPSYVPVLEPTSAKATAILESVKAIEDRFKDAYVNRQETRTNSVTDSKKKKLIHIDCIQYPMDSFRYKELAQLCYNFPVRYMS